MICANRKTPQLMLLRTTLKIKVLHHLHIITTTTHLERYCALCDITKGWTQELSFWRNLLEIRASGSRKRATFHILRSSLSSWRCILLVENILEWIWMNTEPLWYQFLWTRWTRRIFFAQIKSMQDSNGEQKWWRILYHDYVITHYLTVVKQSGFPLDSFLADSGIIKDINIWIKVLGARRRGASGALPQAPSVESIRKRPQTAACWCNTGPSYCFGFYSALYSSLIFSWWLRSR